MGYEISTIVRSEATHNYPIVSGRSRARYAIAAFKSKLSTIFNLSNSVIKAPKFSNDALLGVDITPSCIYVCQIDNKAGSRALTTLASVCMEGKFVGEDILSNPNLYSEKLKKLVRENKIQTKKVALSLPVSSSIIKVVTISKMDDEDISRAIKYGSLWQNLMSQDDSPDNYSIFYQVVRRDDNCDTMDILFVATKLADIKLYKNIVIQSGLKPVVIDAKSVALHYALKRRPCLGERPGTVLVEFGLDDNFVMVMGDSRPRVFNMDMSDTERAAILGSGANGDEEIVNVLINRYSQKLNSIINSYSRMKLGVAIEEIYVMSALPLIGNFVAKLQESLKGCEVKECNMFDYIVIPDSFSISKNSAKNNISSWVGAISMAIFPWMERKEEWIEIRKSPAYGTVYYPHSRKLRNKTRSSLRIGAYDPYGNFYIDTRSTLARIANYPNLIAVAAAVFCVFVITKSYQELVVEAEQLAKREILYQGVAASYTEKAAAVAAMSKIADSVDELREISDNIKKEENQFYVLSMYNYLDTILQQGVWLKELTFTAPNSIEIEGRSIDDAGVMALLDTVSGSKMFSKMALKHIQSIRELDLYTQTNLALKGFVFKGNLADTLPGEYLNKPNFVAGGMLHGG